MTNRPAYALTRWLFLRLLGWVYLTAFVSFGSQVLGLIGSGGILPIGETLQIVASRYPTPDRYTLFPTLTWLNSGDAFLQLLCAGGLILSILLILDILPIPALALLYIVYLSLVTAGREFMGFQWDALLLETGLLALVFAPLHGRPRWPPKEPPQVPLWLLRWLIFRLMFSSGAVKILSGDPAWANLTALTYHYQTQPLPSLLAWYAHQLPLWMQQLSTLSVLVIELGVPFLILLPFRRARITAAGLFIFLQLLTALTGNYTFFNLLTVTLCLPLLDDDLLRRFLPGRAAKSLPERREKAISFTFQPQHVLHWPYALLILLLTLPLTLNMAVGLLRWELAIPQATVSLRRALAPFEIANSYGLFAVMTTTRPEILVEGSDDGQTWRPYEFRFKPGDLSRMPVWVAPYQPRLDWQMWFAALGTYQENYWFGQFLERLLQGSPQVLALLETNPFPSEPPRYLRAMLYDYRFTTSDERAKNGVWWKRVLLGAYSPVLERAGGEHLGGEHHLIGR